VIEEVSPSELGPTDVRIKVAAAAVNPVDVTVLTGPLREVAGLPDPVGLGWDVSGTVTEVGGEVTGLAPGDRVAGILHVIALKPSVGTHADETVLPAAAVAPVPDGLDLVEAASVPLNALTARPPSICSALPNGVPCSSPAAPAPSADTPSSWPPAPAGGDRTGPGH
jgi:NADPH:quinone reductase-like Zn-dependent oxidoreductase